MSEAKYLGDAVYINPLHDGTLVLTTDSHLQEEARNKIFLEPNVALELLDYLQRAKQTGVLS